MQSLPDLTQLSVEQKDELIRLLWPLQQQVQNLMAQMVVMQDRIKQLEGRLAKNSKNSSKPPSSKRRSWQTRTEVTAQGWPKPQRRTKGPHWQHLAPKRPSR